MTFLSWLLHEGMEQRALTDSAIPPNWVGASESGVAVSERTALQHLTVYACVRILADAVASLPLDAYRRRGPTRQEVPSPPAWVTRPDRRWTRFEWLWQLVASLALRGNAYLYVMSREPVTGYPTGLVPLHPDDVVVHGVDARGIPTGAVLSYMVCGTPVDAAEIVHLRRFVLPGSVIGISPIEQARQGIGLGLAAERFGARWFGESANPSSVLETDQALSGDAATHLQKQWISSHGGRRHPAVLSGGVKWRPISITPEESQFLETRKFQRGEIAMLFGIPPHMIGDTERSTSWGAGIEAQGIGFVTYSLRPWLACIEDALSDLTPRGQFVRFNVGGLLRGDQKARYDAYASARTAGWMSVNEIRALEDLPPIEGGDTYIQPLNYGPLGATPTDPAGPGAGQPEQEDDPSGSSDETA
ncbi:phage portal protein [Nocardia sp. NPDC051570]|uniref:phage portal protein n=1 Tax=Nocardia sp. NPDC051570 TaxID=3364324 RepID=UPI0037ADAE8C